MVLGWRRAFCTSIPKNQDKDSPVIKEKSDPNPSPRLGSRFGGLFSTSNPSTPRLQSQPVSGPGLRCKTAVGPPSAAVPTNTPPQSPKLQCRTGNSPRISAPSSPRSPTTFSLLKSSFRISKRCGICVQRVKAGQGTAIFTAECGHSFHFPCIAAHVRKHESLTCPICSSTWNEMHLFHTTDNQQQKPQFNSNSDARCALKVYNDDEPLSSPACGARFNPIPESDETEEEDEGFPGFFVADSNVIDSIEVRRRNVEVALLPEAAVVSVSKSSETCAFVLKIRAPAETGRRGAVDMVTVLDVSRSVTAEKLRLMKKMMRLVVSSLSAADRLSIVAFSTTSRRLLALRRMNTAGRRSARRIIDAAVSLDGGPTSAADSLKKAAKVIEDRREKNPSACILVFSGGDRCGAPVSSTTFADTNIPVHSVSLSAFLHAPSEDTIAKCVTTLLTTAVQDLKIQLGFAPGSAPAEISAVYPNTNKPEYLGSGSSWVRVGDLRSEEEREFLIELKVPSSFGGAQRRLLSVRCSYKDPSTQQLIYEKERPLLIPRPRAAAASSNQRLRCLFIAARAIAESRRLIERNDLNGARRMLSSGRALILQAGLGPDSEVLHSLEAELSELSWKRKVQLQNMAPRSRAAQAEDKSEPLTPTSAWRAAERLAKVAIMRKSLNRVSDLHGFEDARF